jgi:hypothetical protein
MQGTEALVGYLPFLAAERLPAFGCLDNLCGCLFASLSAAAPKPLALWVKGTAMNGFSTTNAAVVRVRFEQANLRATGLHGETGTAANENERPAASGEKSHDR